MKNIIKRGVQIGGGLARVAKKRVECLANELVKERALTQAEKEGFIGKLDKVGEIYDRTIGKEINKFVSRIGNAAEAKRPARPGKKAS